MNHLYHYTVFESLKEIHRKLLSRKHQNLYSPRNKPIHSTHMNASVYLSELCAYL